MSIFINALLTMTSKDYMIVQQDLTFYWNVCLKKSNKQEHFEFESKFKTKKFSWKSFFNKKKFKVT